MKTVKYYTVYFIVLHFINYFILENRINMIKNMLNLSFILYSRNSSLYNIHIQMLKDGNCCMKYTGFLFL